MKRITITLTASEYRELKAAALAFAATANDAGYWTANHEARSRVILNELSDDPRQQAVYEWALDRFEAGKPAPLRGARRALREFDNTPEEDAS